MTTLKGQMDIFDLGLENIPVVEVTKKVVRKAKVTFKNLTIFDELNYLEQEEKKLAAQNVVYPSIEDQLEQLKSRLYEMSKEEGFSWWKHGLPFSNHFYIRYHRQQIYGITDFDREVSARKEKIIHDFLWELGIEHFRQNPKNLGDKRDKSWLGKYIRTNGVLDAIVQKVKGFTTVEEVTTFFKAHAIFDGIQPNGQPDIYYLLPHSYEAACLAQTTDEKEIMELLLYAGKAYGISIYKSEHVFFLLEGQTIETLYYKQLTSKHLDAIKKNFERLGRLHNQAEKYELEYLSFMEKYNAAKGVSDDDNGN